MLSLCIYSISLILFLSFGTYEFLLRVDNVYAIIFLPTLLWLGGMSFDRLYHFILLHLQLAAYEGYIYLQRRNMIQSYKIPRFIKEAETLKKKKFNF